MTTIGVMIAEHIEDPCRGNMKGNHFGSLALTKKCAHTGPAQAGSMDCGPERSVVVRSPEHACGTDRSPQVISKIGDTSPTQCEVLIGTPVCFITIHPLFCSIIEYII